MRWTQTIIPTLKETPAEAQVASHQLLLRAGLIRQVAAGVFDLLPLGARVLRKIERIIRQEMEAIDAIEVVLPSLQPLEFWQRTGRDKQYGENLLQFRDRHGRAMVLGPTHEEVMSELVASCVRSYRQLPLTLYQIGPKFRDEYRPRFGLMRVREFAMKDAYSFHAGTECLERTYQAMYGAYERIFRRCGVPAVAVQADSGPIGGSASHEFVCLSDAGEDTIVISDRGNYAANLERAEIGGRSARFAPTPDAPLEKVHTPGMPGIAEVASFLNVRPARMLKTLVFQVAQPHQFKWLAAVVRGDHEVNPAKLARAARRQFAIDQFELIDTPEVRQRWPIGFVSPRGVAASADAAMVIDPDTAQAGAWVSGADEPDHHVRGFDWQRECGPALDDPARTLVADIRTAVAGDASPLNDGGRLATARGIEIGHVFQIGTRYSQAMDATFIDEQGQTHPMVMGSYGIGLGRIIVSAIESHHDEHGIIWPAAIAPYGVCITPIRYEGAAKAASDRLADQLDKAGIDAILDDRDVRPGVKFADADLVGFPLRITIGEKGLKQGTVEVKARSQPQVHTVKIEQAATEAAAMLALL
jgi:prolyl-tRNA synthetase